jgi:uncharacterized protein YdhG (YjbR/CyaY superfamily)
MTDRKRFKSIDDYMSSFSGPTAERLVEIRKIIEDTLPEAVGAISYNIPAYQKNGVWVAYFSGYKHHVSLLLGGRIDHIVDLFSDELKPYKTSAAAIQFQNDEPLPHDLIVKILKYRYNELTKQ